MEVVKKYHISRILVIALVIVSLVAYSCYTAPKAHAEAFTLTSLFLMLVMSVMASLGVTLLATALQDGIDYLHEHYVDFVSSKGFSNIEDYLVSAGITSAVKLATPIFGAINIGKTVYDMISEFCTWFFSENDVVSGGSEVGNPPSVNYPPILVSYGSSSSFNLSTDQSFPWSNKILSATTFYFHFANGAYITWNNSGSANINRLYLYNSSGSIVASASSNTNSAYNWGSPAIWIYNDNVRITFRQFASSSQTGAGWQSSRIELSISDFYSVVNAEQPSSSGGFIVSPSSSVLSPPSVATGQSYSIPSVNTRPDDDVQTAITDVVAPLTTTGGLSKTASVTGTAVPSEWAWLYEGLESIKNNTSDDRHGTDFIPSNSTMDFGFWHYVPDWISSVGAGFAMFVGVVTSLPSIMLAPLYGILVLGIVVALFHKLWGS